ncbi:MAG: hypothetical protein ACLSHW_05040 [Lachnospiraceae bacterium]
MATGWLKLGNNLVLFERIAVSRWQTGWAEYAAGRGNCHESEAERW